MTRKLTPDRLNRINTWFTPYPSSDVFSRCNGIKGFLVQKPSVAMNNSTAAKKAGTIIVSPAVESSAALKFCTMRSRRMI